jgi:hypothetical protein
MLSLRFFCMARGMGEFGAQRQSTLLTTIIERTASRPVFTAVAFGIASGSSESAPIENASRVRRAG